MIRRAYGKCVRFPLSLFKLKQMAIRVENDIKSEYKSSHVCYDNLKTQVILVLFFRASNLLKNISITFYKKDIDGRTRVFKYNRR